MDKEVCTVSSPGTQAGKSAVSPTHGRKEKFSERIPVFYEHLIFQAQGSPNFIVIIIM